MRSLLLISTTLALAACGGPDLLETTDDAVAALPACSAALKASLLASAAGEVAVVRSGHCQLDYAAADVLRPIRIIGGEASGLRINCHGARIAQKAGSSVTTMISVAPQFDAAAVEAEMLKVYEAGHGTAVAPYGVSRPEEVSIDGCQVFGAINLGTAGGNIRSLSSRSQLDTQNAQHTLRTQAVAVRGVHLSHLRIEASPELGISNLVYFQQGVSASSLTDSTLSGQVSGVTLYLAPEGTGNSIERNRFDVAHADGAREIIAIDGSSNNVIRGNSFRHLDDGGIYLYRNCGEEGGTRHQTPSGNEISDNDFFYHGSLSASVWVGRRVVAPIVHQGDGFLSFLDIPDTYCQLDERPLRITLADGSTKVLARSKEKLGSAADTFSIPIEFFGFTVAHLDVNADGARNNSIHDNALLNYGSSVYRRIDKFSEAVDYPGADKKNAAIKFSGPNVEAINTQTGNAILQYPSASCRPSPPPVTIGGVTRNGSFDASTGRCYLLPR
ncbi:MAG: right-handed parallel beta-helix repeat-containing protein [Myxococcota bacterium]